MRYEQRLQNESTSAYHCFEGGFHILFDLGFQHVVNETPTAPERQVDFPYTGFTILYGNSGVAAFVTS